MPQGFRRDATLDTAREHKERWQCGAKKRTELPPDLAAESRYVATITRTPEATTCPLECVQHADEWVLEMTQAASLGGELNIPIETYLGRDLTQVDIEAIKTIKTAQYDACKSNQQIAAQQKKTPSGAR